VTLRIARTTDRSYPGLPDLLDRRISDRTGREVIVEVSYVDYERSDERITRSRERLVSPRSLALSPPAGRPPAWSASTTGRTGRDGSE
jgi:hypothetical protein